MFDIGADELLLTAIVAIVVIGPKDLPRALRVTGRWVAKMRRMSNAFRSGFENMVRDAEMEEMEREWKERNAAIMLAHPGGSADADAAAAAAAATYDHQHALDHPVIEHQPLPAEAPVTAHTATPETSSTSATESAPAPAHPGGD